MNITIQPSALRDLRDGFRFYESQEHCLGSYFLDSISADIDSLRLYAGIHAVHFGRFHRMLCKRFPYAVYNQLDDDQVLVRAVLDLRRDPLWIVRKLKGLS